MRLSPQFKNRIRRFIDSFKDYMLTEEQKKEKKEIVEILSRKAGRQKGAKIIDGKTVNKVPLKR